LRYAPDRRRRAASSRWRARPRISTDSTRERDQAGRQSVAALGDRLLVELNEGLTYEDRIDRLRGSVARLITPIYVFGETVRDAG
jgi:hypothetical protein